MNQALQDIREQSRIFKGLVLEHLPPGIAATIAYQELETAILKVEDVVLEWNHSKNNNED